MITGRGRAFAADPQALWVAEGAIVRGFDAGLTKDQRMFLYLPFQHSEDRQSQARSVALSGKIGTAPEAASRPYRDPTPTLDRAGWPLVKCPF